MARWSLSLGVLVVAGTIGVLAGLYLSEFAPPRVASVARFFSEVLAGVPSIVVGYVGYLVLVNKGGLGLHYSLLAGIIALSALILPYIVKTTELAFSSVPRTLREGAIALGMSRGKTIRKVLLPPALPGIVSGLVLALRHLHRRDSAAAVHGGLQRQEPFGSLAARSGISPT